MSKIELNLNEMEEVTGGKGGSPAPLAPTATFDVHKIRSGETLTQIANRYKTNANYLMDINPTITNKNDITAGYYIYVPRLLK